MTIRQEEFNYLVNNIEHFSKNNPEKYRLRVTLFALLGYGYIFLILAGLLAMIGLIIAFFIFSHRLKINILLSWLF
jgi:cytoskeletal protein RodZ